MNDIDTEHGLSDYYRSIAPASSVRATRRVDASIRARRERYAPDGTSERPRILAGIAAVMTVALVAGICFSSWRTGPIGLPAVANGSPSASASASGSVSPSGSPSAIGPSISPAAMATLQPAPTLRAATKSTPSRHFSLTAAPTGNYDTATLLQDGRVLLTGEFTSQTIGSFNVPVWTTAAELYDPATGKFSPTGSMARAQGGGSTTLLADGRVLVAGGVEYSGSAGKLTADKLADAELYDPATGTFTATGSMGEIRADQTATLLADGEVLVAGGDNLSGSLATAELYDPASGTFHSTGSMTEARSQAKAVRLHDGRVLIYWGFGATTMPKTAELYEPTTGKFSAIAWPGGGLYPDSASVTLLQDGRLLVAGGSDGSNSVATAQLFDPATGASSPTGSMATPREAHSAVLLSNGQVLIAGGMTAHLYGYEGAGQQAALSGNDPAFQLDEHHNAPGGNSTGSQVFGMTGPPPTYLTSAELYDPATGKFTSTGSMRTWLLSPTATLLLDGRVLFIGQDSKSRETAELYQP